MRAPESGSKFWMIFGNLEKETEKAYLWKLAESNLRPFWMPKSQCKNLNIIPNDEGFICIEVKEWILQDKGVHHNDWYEIDSTPPKVDTSKSNREFDLDAPPWEDPADNYPF